MSLKKFALIALIVIMVAGMITFAGCKKKAAADTDTTAVEQPMPDTAAIADTAKPVVETPAPEAKPAETKKTK